MIKITLKEYADIKDSSIEDVIKNASEKGITIHAKPDFLLSEEILKEIDPICHYNLKYKRSVGTRVCAGPKIVDKIDLSLFDKSTHQKKRVRSTFIGIDEIFNKHYEKLYLDELSESKDQDVTDYKTSHQLNISQEYSKQKKNNKRIIGVVKFFDWSKDFGFVVSGSKGVSNKPENSRKIYDFYINSSQWKSDSYPNNGDWIVFTPKNSSRGRSVVDGERLTYDKDGLLLGMSYRGRYSCISGIDSKGDIHDHNVLCHIIDVIKGNNDNAANIIINAFAEYISGWQPEKVNDIISQFLYDKSLCKELISMLPSMKSYHHDNPLYAGIINALTKSVEESIFSKLDISIFNALPSDFKYNTYKDKTFAVIEASLKDNITGVAQWLSKHQEFLEEFKSDICALSLELLYAVYESTKDIQVFVNSNKPWNEQYGWLQKKSDSLANDYILAYFADRDEAFVEQCHISDILTETELSNIVWKFLADPTRYSAILESIAYVFVTKDLDVLKAYIRNGIDFSSIYPALGICLNNLVKENEIDVRDFLDLCIKQSISIGDLFTDTSAISDEMFMELFVLTGEIDNLNAVQNFEVVPIWLNGQTPEWICNFLQCCQKLFTDEEDKEAIADTLIAIDENKFKDAISLLDEDTQYKVLKLCPEDYSRDIVSKYFASTKLFELYIGEQWKRLKAEVPYVAFDIESDGSTITEFAFRTDENTKVYQGEDQLGTLLRALKRTEIIVGHRVKEWDLGKVLSKKGFESKAFIWDTLEIEILLNPCRYSFALHTGHTAQEDTELVDRLFWNQLYRLSQNESLCNELSDFLPEKIKTIIENLHQPAFSNFFKQTSGSDDCFYQVLIDTDETMANRLQMITEGDSKALIIAPKRLWPRISESVSLSFV